MDQILYDPQKTAPPGLAMFASQVEIRSPYEMRKLQLGRFFVNEGAKGMPLERVIQDNIPHFTVIGTEDTKEDRVAQCARLQLTMYALKNEKKDNVLELNRVIDALDATLGTHGKIATYYQKKIIDAPTLVSIRKERD